MGSWGGGGVLWVANVPPAFVISIIIENNIHLQTYSYQYFFAYSVTKNIFRIYYASNVTLSYISVSRILEYAVNKLFQSSIVHLTLLWYIQVVAICHLVPQNTTLLVDWSLLKYVFSHHTCNRFMFAEGQKPFFLRKSRQYIILKQMHVGQRK